MLAKQVPQAEGAGNKDNQHDHRAEKLVNFTVWQRGKLVSTNGAAILVGSDFNPTTRAVAGSKVSVRIDVHPIEGD